MNTFTPSVNAFRFYDDDSTEAASTPLANQDTNITVNLDGGNVALQLRYRLQEGGGADGGSTDDYALQFAIGGGGFTTVTGATTGVIASTSGLTNDNATTNRATNGIADGSGSFIAGEQCTDGTLDNHQLTASNYTEHVFGITLVAADLNDADSITFRISLNGGTPGITNSVTPTITADFSVDALTANDITTGTPTLASATIGQTHVLLANDITTGTPTLGTPALAITHPLLAEDITAGTPTLTAPVIGQVHVLAANDIATGAPTLTSPALADFSGVDELLANDILSGQPALTSPSIGQIHVLLANGISAGVPTLGVPSVDDGTSQFLPAGGTSKRRMPKKYSEVPYEPFMPESPPIIAAEEDEDDTDEVLGIVLMGMLNDGFGRTDSRR